MKKLLAILLALSMLLLCACSAPDSSGISSPSGGDNPDSSYTGSISQTESKEPLESSSAAEEDPENSADTTSESDRDDNDQEESDPGTVKAPNQSQETTGKDNPKETLPLQSSGDDNSSEITTATQIDAITTIKTTKFRNTSKTTTHSNKSTTSQAVSTKYTSSVAVTTILKPDVTKHYETSKTDTLFDINRWITYAKRYAESKGLVLSDTAVDCWDNPIRAGAHCIYLERDIQSRLNRYAKDEDITDVWIWAEEVGNDCYDIYIGYA